jgi:undecaprenyl-diphosphatase
MNYELFKMINGLAGKSHLLDKIEISLSKYAFVIYALILLFMWFRSVDYKKTVFYAVITAVVALGGNAIIHKLFYEPRPFVTHQVNLLYQHVRDSGFPSDHAAGVFSISIVILMRHRKFGFLTIVLATLVGISRVFVGHHYPYDVLAGVCVAIIAANIVSALRKMLEPLFQVLLNIYNKIPFLSKIKY